MPPQSKLQSFSVTVNGCRMFARRSAAPPPGAASLILVHGLSVSSRYMLPLANALAADFDVYVPDLPGFGQSEDPERGLDVPQMADTLAAWMDLIGLPSAAMLGNSAGCQVIVDLALRRPERVTAAFLVGPTVDRERRAFWPQAIRLLLDALREPPRLLAIVTRDYIDAGLRPTLHTMRHVLNDAIEHKLPDVSAPTLVIRGASDPIVPQRWAEEVARRLPRSALVVLPGAHGVHFTAAERVAELVRRRL